MQIYDDMVFENPIETICAFDEHQFKNALEKIEHISKTHYLLGYIRYEAKEIFLNKKISSKLPLLYFEVFDSFKPYKPQNRDGIFIHTKPCITFEEYRNDLKKIKEEIAQGNTYEVNYTYDFDVFTDADEKTLYEYLLKYQKTPYNAFIKNEYETLLSFSPELFFEIEDNKILTKPMKGTVKRGNSEDEDKKNIEFLKNDIKNRAENVMIVDLLRNDLSKIAKTGTVNVPKLFEIETHKTLHQMTSEITAELKEKTSLYDIFEAIFPCGSITGAPKISTMEIIDRIERGQRNIYCGAIGFLSPKKSVFSVPIRILQKNCNEIVFKYRVGGAVVWDSEIKDEWDETVTKMSFLNLEQKDIKIIETCKVENNKILYADEHFNRMENTAKRLGFIFPYELKNLKPQKDGMTRILLSKNGHYDVEYKELNEEKTNVISLSDSCINSQNPFLFHKTTLRPWYKKSFEKIKSQAIYDEIFYNEKGELTEGSRTNIVLQIKGELFTPPVKCGLVNGVLRQKLINENKIKEKILYKKDLQKAEKIFCINSVRGMKEVKIAKTNETAVST